jgi:hypothetical protein
MNTVTDIEADTIWVHGATFAPLAEVHALHASDGNGGTSRLIIRDSTAELRQEVYDVRYPSPQGRSTASDSAAPSHGKSQGRNGQDVPLASRSGRVDTVITRTDTVLAFPRTRYPCVLGSNAELVTMLMATPIVHGWKRSYVIMALIPVDLEGVDDARVEAPGGKVDCWKLVRRGPTKETAYLVRKRDGVLISLRTEGTFQSKRFMTEMVLIGEQ